MQREIDINFMYAPEIPHIKKYMASWSQYMVQHTFKYYRS